jgi:hypothetical protein
MRIPASGAVKIRVCDQSGCASTPYDPPASYWFVVNRINRAPEKITATFALGDSVKGESIDFPGDVDEFTITGTANQNVRVAFQYYTDGWQATSTLGLQLELIDSTISAVLTTVTVPSAQLDDATLPTVTLPHDGTYLVRIQDQLQLPYYTRNWGPYHFRIAAAP